jgi:hypothetical protein
MVGLAAAIAALAPAGIDRQAATTRRMVRFMFVFSFLGRPGQEAKIDEGRPFVN